MRKAIAGSLALAAVALLGLSAQAQLLQKKALTLAAARKMVAAAQPEAERNHWRGVVAVADDGDWLILLGPMDHAAMTASVELAAGKARSAALFKKRRWRRQSTRVATRRNRSRIHRDARRASDRGRRRGDRRHRSAIPRSHFAKSALHPSRWIFRCTPA
jgi:hypothetical protein